MGKITKLTALILVFLLIAGGCTRTKLDNTKDSNQITDSPKSDTTKEETSDVQFLAEVITVGTSLLVAPDSSSAEYKSSDVISVSTIDASITNQKGDDITLNELAIGDILQITYNGMILESYPAQISASAIEVTEHDNLSQGFLALIDDLYQDDSALNSEITMISFDTTDWTDLSDNQKKFIFTAVKNMYNVEVLDGTFDEMAEQGYIDKDNLYYPKGIHIVIADVKVNKDKDKITCSIEKWRSGLGAIGSSDVTATYKKGEWTIKKEGMWIS